MKVFLETTQKDTAKRSKELVTYYLFLDKDITEIYTYGFSFSEVDLVYIRDICATLDTTKITWFLSDFDSEQKIEEFKKLIIKCGFKGIFNTFGVGCSSKKSNDENKGYLRYLEEQRKYLGKANFELRQFILDYYTIGYQRPEGYKHSSSSFLMIPRLIKILFIIILERVQDFFKQKIKQKNQTKEKNLNRRQ